MNRILTHFLFWLSVLLFYAVYFGAKGDSFSQSLFFVAFFLPVTIATTYTINYWLIPRYLKKGLLPLFALYCGYILLISIYAELAAFIALYLINKSFQSLFEQPLLLDLMDILVGMYIVIFAAVAIHLVRKWRVSEGLVSEHRSQRFKAENELEDIKQNSDRILTLRVDREDHQIREKDIVYIESQRDYALLHLRNSSILTKRTLASLLEDLNPDEFIRIHRSYVVQLNKITSSSSTSVHIEDTSLPIGRSYKDHFLSKLHLRKGEPVYDI